MDFRLQVFADAARTLNFSRTAQNLGISQPSVSTHIKLLEEDLKVKLFLRQGRRFVLTYAGELLLQKAEKILSIYKEMNQEASLLSNISEGEFTLGIPRAIYYGVFPNFVADWCRLSPKSTIHHKIIDLKEQNPDIAGNLDAFITLSLDPGKDNIFFSDTLIAVTPSKIKEDGYYDIAETKLLMYEGDPETSADISARMSAALLNPSTLKIAATMKDPVSAIKFLIEYGKGSATASSPLVSFLWKSQVSTLLKEGVLRQISLTEMEGIPIPRRHYAIFLAKNKKGSNEAALKDNFISFAQGWASSL